MSIADIVKDEELAMQISLRSDDRLKKGLIPKLTRWYLRREVCSFEHMKKPSTTVT